MSSQKVFESMRNEAKCNGYIIQTNFNGLNTDDSFTTAGLNLFLGPLEKIP